MSWQAWIRKWTFSNIPATPDRQEYIEALHMCRNHRPARQGGMRDEIGIQSLKKRYPQSAYRFYEIVYRLIRYSNAACLFKKFPYIYPYER